MISISKFFGNSVVQVILAYVIVIGRSVTMLIISFTVPFINRMCSRDSFFVYKKGSKIRIDCMLAYAEYVPTENYTILINADMGIVIS